MGGTATMASVILTRVEYAIWKGWISFFWRSEAWSGVVRILPLCFF